MTQQANKLKLWMVVWLSLNSFELTSFTLYVLLRPHSFTGGALGFLWPHYAAYAQIDHSIADMNNAFVWGQAVMTAVEVGVGLAALWMNHLRKLPQALLLACLSCALTAAKTALILIVEAKGGLASVGHNATSDILLMYVLPTSVWVVVPMLVVVSAGRQLLRACDPTGHGRVHLAGEPTSP